jgi:hypothetical protein
MTRSYGVADPAWSEYKFVGVTQKGANSSVW